MLAVLDEFGFAEHFMADYGDEENYRDPCSLFDEKDVQKFLATMHKCFALAEKFYQFYFPKSA